MSVGLKNVCRTWPLPGASRTMAASAASTTTVLAVDNAAPRRLRSPSIRDRRADRSGSPCSGKRCASTYGWMVGTLVKSFRYCPVSLASVPLPFSVASALFTQVTSLLPLANSRP